MSNCPICTFDPRFVIREEGPVAACLYPPDAVRPGHVLVYPKAHREGLSALTSEEAQALMSLACRLSAAVEAETGAVKCYPLAIGDVNAHFHLHLLPKLREDPSIGPFIMGPQGWRGLIHQPVDETGGLRMIVQLKERLES